MTPPTRTTPTPALERRFFPVTELRVAKDEAGAGTITGYAAVFDRDSEDLGWFIEQVAPGAFARSIRAAKDNPVTDMIHAFWSHDPSQVLASTRSGKLVLEEDAHGLKFSFPAERLTPAQRGAVEDGDMRMSFGFFTQKDEWTRGGPGKPDRRRVLDADLLEISPVAKPAYPQTSVTAREHPDFAFAVRSHAAWEQTQVPTPTATGVPPIQRYADRLKAIEATL